MCLVVVKKNEKLKFGPYLPPTLPFGRISFVVLVMRKGGESS